MHTFNGKKSWFNYNSDMSGKVIISNKEGGEEIEVEASDILGFVAEHVRREAISKLEEMDTKELLKIKINL